MKIFLESLGCVKNLSDSEDMAGILASLGHRIVSSEEEADILLINTCAFLRESARESENEISRLEKYAEKGKKIIVAGCMVERFGNELLEKHKKVFSFIGTNSVLEIARALEGENFLKPEFTGILPSSPAKLRLTLPHSAYLKIAEGCGNGCSYCTIPRIKGPYRSKKMEDIIGEAKALAESGAVEISLIAQDTAMYGKDIHGKAGLPALLRRMAKIKNLKWIRIMYAYPERISESLMETIGSERKVCNYLDMPIQHISDSILKRMNRPLSRKVIISLLEKLRRKIPGLYLRTTVMTGFPGETEKDFRELLAFVKDYEFDHLGVFSYSREKGTPAYGMAGQIPEKVKRERFLRLIDAQSRTVAEKLARGKGRVIEVLTDFPFSGRHYGQAPDIDGRVILESRKPVKPGTFMKVRVTGSRGCDLTAAPIP